MAVKLRRLPDGKKKRNSKLPTPLPEAIDGGRWEIKPSGHRRDGLAELHPGGGGRMTIPLGGDEVERAMRLHEQMHAAITPREPEVWDGVDETVLQLCEDRRVHHALENRGFGRQLQAMGEMAPDMAIEWQRLKLDYDNALKKRDKAGRSLALVPPRAITAARVMASYDTGLFESEYKAAQELDKEAADYGLDLAQQFTGAAVRPFADAKTAAEMLCDMFGSPSVPFNEEEEKRPAEMPLMPYYSDSPRPFLPELSRAKEDVEAMLKGEKPDMVDSDTGKSVWTDMKIIEKPKPLRLNGRLLGGKRKVPDIRGRNLRRPYRLAQDGHVFHNKHYVRKRGGAVLIDCSGSMSLEAEEVEAIMVAMPAAVIATYAGRGSSGQLWIVAREGKRAKVDDLHPELGGNIVDAPALRWLNEQKGPRYWVSDGIVTTHGDQQTPYVVAVCRVLQKQGNIVRVPDTESVLTHQGWERIA